MANLLRLQGGACAGNTLPFLNAEEPRAVDRVTDLGIIAVSVAQASGCATSRARTK